MPMVPTAPAAVAAKGIALNEATRGRSVDRGYLVGRRDRRSHRGRRPCRHGFCDHRRPGGRWGVVRHSREGHESDRFGRQSVFRRSRFVDRRRPCRRLPHVSLRAPRHDGQYARCRARRFCGRHPRESHLARIASRIQRRRRHVRGAFRRWERRNLLSRVRRASRRIQPGCPVVQGREERPRHQPPGISWTPTAMRA